MIKVPVHSMAGGLVAELDVDESQFGSDVNHDVLRQAIVTYEANQRAGTAKTKTRGEVAGSNRKPWRQKHTGRARAGRRSSPVWVGGGVVFGPAPRDYTKKLNKKMRRKALASALLAKLKAGEVRVLERIELRESKTGEMARILKGLGIERTFLIVLPRHDPVLWRCTRNIPGASVLSTGELNAYEVLLARDVIFTREAFDQLLGRAQQASQPAAGTQAASVEGDQ